MELTDEQRAAVEAGPGPAIVLAGAGTGKTTVIVERAGWLLERFGEGGPRTGDPLLGGAPGPGGATGPLLPENILVLTYNVRATEELTARFERRLGTDVAGRMRIQNFHAFGYAVMTENAADAGYGARLPVLDSVGQRLLLRELRPGLDLVYYRGGADPYHALPEFAALIDRARDELVTPDDFDRYVDGREAEFVAGFGPLGPALESILARGDLARLKEVRRDALAGNGEVAAHREARRDYFGDGYARSRGDVPPEDRAQVEGDAELILRDAAALEVLRLREHGRVYRAYQVALAERNAFDFGEQIARAIAVLEALPNVRRRYQQRFRHILVDEFQDANIAQIRLLELIGLAPDRPANVLVVGDDDQSIYRFRGASYAAFRQFEDSFGAAARACGHDGVPTLPLTLNRRSTPQVLRVAGRLIARNQTRFAPDKALRPGRPDGAAVELVFCRDDAEEADVLLERLQGAWAEDARPAKRWRDYAILYRKHRARAQILERLQRAEIPYHVAGGIGLWAYPEIRDLEAALRVLVAPDESVSLVRLMTAGPWRFDATEILRLTRMADARGQDLLSTAREVLRRGELEVEVPAPPGEGDDGHAGPPGAMRSWLELVDGETAIGGPAPDAAPGRAGGRLSGREERRAREERRRRRREALEAGLRARLTRLLGLIDELTPSVYRDGPFTVLDAYLKRTNRLHDLLAVGTLEAQRDVLAMARLLRFAARWQRDEPDGTLATFLRYLDVYQEVGGEPEGDGAAGIEADGVRLMTIHQAKGLEFRAVFVPQVVERMMPDLQADQAILPVELLRQRAPEDFSLQEERRLAYVACTRARDLLVLTTVEGGGSQPSRFVGEVMDGRGPELAVDESRVEEQRRVAAGAAEEPGEPAARADGAGGDAPPGETVTAALLRRLPLPTAQERRFALRRRAVELIGALEAVDPQHPFAAAERLRLTEELVAVARDAAREADESRLRGLDPLTLRVVAADTPSGARLLELAPPPETFSYSSFRTYRECPFRFALERVYRIPVPETKPYFAFGTIAHEVFQRFVEERRAARAAGEPEPGPERLRQLFEASWTPDQFADPVVAASYRTRSVPMLEAFHRRELAREAEVVATELWFDLPIDPGDGSPAVIVSGAIDRIDRLPDGSIEIVDYKTGRPRNQGEVDADEQLTIYALAARDAVLDPATGRRLGRPARLTLYFTEADARVSTWRSDEQLDACRADLVALAGRVRAGDFAATPGREVCRGCDYGPVCPSRHEDGARA